jgi:hypothetical protein
MTIITGLWPASVETDKNSSFFQDDIREEKKKKKGRILETYIDDP